MLWQTDVDQLPLEDLNIILVLQAMPVRQIQPKHLVKLYTEHEDVMLRKHLVYQQLPLNVHELQDEAIDVEIELSKDLTMLESMSNVMVQFDVAAIVR
jgi:hypothetical protein